MPSFFKDRFKGVIFDMDGVIIDSEPVHLRIWEELLQKYGDGLEDENEFKALLGKSEKAIVARMKQVGNLRQDEEEIAHRYQERLKECFSNGEFPAVEGAVELIRELDGEGIPLMVASSSSKLNIVSALTALGVAGCFEGFVSGEDFRHAKPAPDIYLAAAAGLGFLPHECAAIEDTETGIASAKSAGLYTVAYLNPFAPLKKLDGVDKAVGSMRELG